MSCYPAPPLSVRESDSAPRRGGGNRGFDFATTFTDALKITVYVTTGLEQPPLAPHKTRTFHFRQRGLGSPKKRNRQNRFSASSPDGCHLGSIEIMPWIIWQCAEGLKLSGFSATPTSSLYTCASLLAWRSVPECRRIARQWAGRFRSRASFEQAGTLYFRHAPALGASCRRAEKKFRDGWKWTNGGVALLKSRACLATSRASDRLSMRERKASDVPWTIAKTATQYLSKESNPQPYDSDDDILIENRVHLPEAPLAWLKKNEKCRLVSLSIKFAWRKGGWLFFRWDILVVCLSAVSKLAITVCL